MTTLAEGEHTNSSLLRSLYLKSAAGHPHVGFGWVMPILLPEKMAGVHLFLREDQRHSLPQYAQSILSLAHQILPGIRLCILDAHPSWAAYFVPFGFEMHTMFVEKRT